MQIELMPQPMGGHNWLFRDICWLRAHIDDAYDYDDFRCDDDGNLIKQSDFQQMDSQHGWGIGYKILPKDGGKAEFSNMRPVWLGRAVRIVFN